MSKIIILLALLIPHGISGGSWTEIDSATPPARFHHGMTYDSTRGRIVLYGGNVDGIISDSTWEFDLSTQTWEMVNTSESPPGLNYHAMVYDDENKVVILFGGVNDKSVPTNETWVYDGSNWVNMRPSDAPSIRRGHSMVYDSTSKQVILFGGIAMKDGILKPVSDTWIYNYQSNTWKELNVTISPSPRHTAAMTFDPVRSRIILYGGNVGYHSDHNGDTWTFDPLTQKWEEQYPEEVPTPLRGDFDMVYNPLVDGYILFGGNNKTNYFGDTWFLDPSFQTWVQIDSTGPKGRGSDQSLVAVDDEVYLYGGFDEKQGLDDMWLFRPDTTSTISETSKSEITSSKSTSQEAYFSPLLFPLAMLVIRRRSRRT